MVDAMVFIAVLIVIAFGIASLGALTSSAQLRMDAIERGHALYCPVDGEWSWKGECDG